MERADFEDDLTLYLTYFRDLPRVDLERTAAVYQPGPGAEYSNWYWSTICFRGDYLFSCPTRRAACALQRAGATRLFQYYFAQTPLAPPFSFGGLFRNASISSAVPGTAGACHETEVLFVFEVEEQLGSEQERELAATMASYWVNFARASDPNVGPARASLTVPWAPFAAGAENSLEFRLPKLASALSRLEAQCDFFDSLGPMPPPRRDDVVLLL